MKLILLGATGFIGSNILPLLAELGDEIYAVQRKPNARQDHVASGVRWVTPAELLDLPSGLTANAILSTAGGGEPAAFETDPAAALTAELKIADCIAALANKFQAPSVLYLSSGGTIYGEGRKNGQQLEFEENDTCCPVSTYGKCKLASETRLAEQLDSIGLLSGLAILRASNVYGLHYVKDGRQGLINSVVERALNQRPITIYGDGLIYRDYLFSSDLAYAITKVLHTNAGGVFNIAAGRSHSILDVIKQVEAAVGYCIEKQFEPARGIDVKYSALSIRKAQRVLGWTPAVSLKRGIELVLNSKGGIPVLQSDRAVQT